MTKQKYSFLILIFLNAFYLNAQNLVEIDNQWNIAVYPTFSPITLSYSLKIGEDTTINNILYNKVYYSNDSLNTNWQFSNDYLRQDSTKKVYHKEGDGNERLLYDFSLALNDTFFIEGICTLVVTEIDSIALNNGEMRKRLKLEPADIPNWGSEYWIDGIGSNFGLLSHFGFCFFDYPDGFLCFYSNAQLQYPATPPSCFITPVEELDRKNIKIFPNPVHDILTIEDEEINLTRVILYDISGKIVKSNELRKTKNTINLSDLKNGFYLLILAGKDGYLYSKKLIKN